MVIKHYKNQKCNFNTDLLKNDEYTFSVLIRILQNECRLTVTDNESFVICHSEYPHPVWVWLSPTAPKKVFEQVYLILKKDFFEDKSLKFNAGYNFADYLIHRAYEDGNTFNVATNMFAYRCVTPIPPHKKPTGCYALACMNDIELATEYMQKFNESVGIERRSLDDCKAKIIELISDERLFFWCDENGEKVAMASYGVAGKIGNVGNVFTRNDKRRCGYAANLVYNITLKILSLNKIPTLYTDADYAASNACYEEIGYKKMGSLCTVEQN